MAYVIYDRIIDEKGNVLNNNLTDEHSKLK